MGYFGRGMEEGRGEQEEKKNSQRRVKGIRSHFNADVLQQMQTRIISWRWVWRVDCGDTPKARSVKEAQDIVVAGFRMSGRQGVTSPVTGL